jgi:molybdopterin molybdotransferase
MISVNEAKKIILEHTPHPVIEAVPLLQAAARVLAQDQFSSIDIPGFAQSSMDGYALSFTGWKTHETLTIVGEVPAGGDAGFTIAPQNTVRIFTGAPLPAGLDTVVMREKVRTEGDKLMIDDNDLQAGKNVRLQASEIKKGEIALSAGSLLTPAAIGFLAMLGIDTVPIYAHPTITILVTGKELQQPGKPLEGSQVYEANSFSLSAALKLLGFTAPAVLWADDDLETLTVTLQNAVRQSDLVIITGGVSAGDYDFVPEAAARCGIIKQFHKIKQRPGKPIFFGTKGNQLVFGLPGNPASVMTCFYQYVLMALNKWTGKDIQLKTVKVRMSNRFEKAAGLTHFLKGYYNGNTVTSLDAQESFRLSSFATANCLIKIEEDATSQEVGSMVEVLLLS